MKIYIPTAGRAHRQITLESLPLDADVALVCPPDEVDDHRRVLEAGGFTNGHVINFGGRGIRTKRQFILDYHWITHALTKLVMLDDDLKFRRREDDGRYVRSTEIGELITSLEDLLGTYAHVGVCDEFMSNHNPRGGVTGKRYNQVLAYDLNKFPTEILKSTFRLDINEEHDLHLRLASMGRPGYVSTEWTKGSTFYAEGGCSTWRTAEVEEKAHRQLAELWPDWVKVVPNKSSLSGWGIRVAWRKANEKALAKARAMGESFG